MEVELKAVRKPSQQPLLSEEEPANAEDCCIDTTAINNENSNSGSEVIQFKPAIFLEFFCYLVIKMSLGPFSPYFFKKFIKNGLIISKNIQINEGKLKNFVGMMKFYCIVTTFLFLNDWIRSFITGGVSGYEYNSTSQLWLLVHTEISLCVLYGAYYASLADNEILKLKTELCIDNTDIFDRVLNLIRLGKAKLYEMINVAKTFPEIDVDNFYFVYPQESQGKIPAKLLPEPMESCAPQLQEMGLENGIIVQCDKYATHIAECSGYQKLDFRVKMIQYGSRGLVFMNAILPVINNIYQILAEENHKIHIVAFIIYSTQQLFYSYLLYRLAAVYDVLFLGLLLYFKKYQMLSLLGEVIKAKPDETVCEGLLYLPTSVPINVENWLAVRKVLATINGQAFVVIDLNMSFVLLYTLIFIFFYVLASFNVASELFIPFQQFLVENPGIQAVLTLTIVVIAIVLILDIALGILINRLFMYEKHEWVLQETMITKIKAGHEIYRHLTLQGDPRKAQSVAYAEKMQEIKSFLGSGFQEKLHNYAKRIRDSIIMVIKAIDHEEFFNPHTLLGIRTDVRLVVGLGTAISAIGLSTIMKIAQGVVNTNEIPA